MQLNIQDGTKDLIASNNKNIKNDQTRNQKWQIMGPCNLIITQERGKVVKVKQNFITIIISGSWNRVKIRQRSSSSLTVVYVLLNVAVSVLATWWPPAPIRVARKLQPGRKAHTRSLTTPSEWERDTDKERGRESCLCPFLDIVDNHNNRDKFQSALACVIARGDVCLSK